jgi:CubicO group peptidase (beta-lactamase class C family)
MDNPAGKYLSKLREALGGAGRKNKLPPLEQADTNFSGWIGKGRIPGMAITVRKGGNVIFEKGYGFADLEMRTAVNPSKTFFRAASVSKPIAATALLMAVSQGLIALDASLYFYVPYFPKKKYDFTIRQLAGHTAGIRGYRGKEYALDCPLSIKESLAVFGDDPLLFRPGTSFHYNSFDWVLVSLAIEEAAGMPFAEYVRREVLQPLGMTRTIPEIKGEAPVGLASFYSPAGCGFRGAIPVNNAYKLAGGGYLSTAADIARLGQAYLDGAVGNSALVKEFTSTQYIGTSPTWYGLGWEVSRDKAGQPYFGHTGNSIGAYSKFLVYPETEMVVAVLVNCTNPGIDTDLQKIMAGFH